VVFDNIKEIGDAASRALPLRRVYETSESMALEAAKAAAHGGDLDAKSARFLPFEYQADFEKVAGIGVADAPGSAVKGVTIRLDGDNASVRIRFKQALEGQTANKVVLGLTQRAAIIAERLEPAENPDLPPYWIYISPRPGKNPSGTQLVREAGSSSFTMSDIGTLIRAGRTEVKLVRSSDANTTTNRMTFDLDEVNDLGSQRKLPSAKTKAVRELWLKRFDEPAGEFNLSRLPELSRAQFEALPGAKTLLSGVRRIHGPIGKLLESGRLELVHDPLAKTAVAYVKADGESENWLYVLDERARRWVGTWSVSDDGSTRWDER
jgi:hypothetical protein